MQTPPDKTVAPIAVNADDAAAMFGLKAKTWRRLNSAGEIPNALTIGGSVRWRVDELRAWAEAGSPSRAEWNAQREIERERQARRK